MLNQDECLELRKIQCKLDGMKQPQHGIDLILAQINAIIDVLVKSAIRQGA